MTNKLEKQFFDTFGIEPKKEYYCPNCETKLEKWNTPKGMQYICGNDSECDYFLESYDEEFKEVLNNLDFRLAYPQITPEILLELICILGNTSYFLITDDGLPIDVDGLKKSVLHSLTLQAKIDKNKVLKHQVRTLFEEG